MTRRGFIWLAVPLFVICNLSISVLALPAVAQEKVEALTPGEALYEIRLVDGSVLFARVIALKGETIVLVTLGGTRLEVERSQIGDASPAEGQVVGGEFWREDPNSSRLFFTATGRTLPKGEAYAGTYLVVLPFVAVGVTDRFTMAAGAPVLLGTLEPFYLAPKVQLINTTKAAISVGALVLFTGEETVGITYGVGTFGTVDQALTLGVGFGFSGDDFYGQPVGMIGGETRVSRRVKLITENYLLPDENGLVASGGLRFIGDRFSTDVSIAGIVGDEGGCCLPILNFSYAFGRGR